MTPRDDRKMDSDTAENVSVAADGVRIEVDSSVNVIDVENEPWIQRRVGVPYAAIYVTGRLINALDWLRLHAALNQGSRAHTSVRQVYERLLETTFLTGEMKRAVLLNGVCESFHELWRDSYESEMRWHWYEGICDKAESNGGSRLDPKYWSDDDKTVNETAEHLDDMEARILQLGLDVDRGVRTLAPGTTDDIYNHLGRGCLRPYDATAESAWYGRVRGIRKTIGIDDGMPRGVRHRSDTDHSGVVDDIDRQIRACLERLWSQRSSEDCYAVPESGFLQLRVDPLGRLVSRTSVPNKIVDMSSCETVWSVFQICWNASENGTDWSMVKPRYGGEWDARHAVVKELRKLLKPIRITVAQRRLQLIALDIS